MPPLSRNIFDSGGKRTARYVGQSLAGGSTDRHCSRIHTVVCWFHLWCFTVQRHADPAGLAAAPFITDRRKDGICTDVSECGDCIRSGDNAGGEPKSQPSTAKYL